MIDVPGLGDPRMTTKKWLSVASELSNKKVDLVLFILNSTLRVSNDQLVYSLAIKCLVEEFDTAGMAFCYTRCGTNNFTF